MKITTDEELKSFVHNAFGVSVPDVQVCPDHTTPFRALADAYFARSPIAVWEASRGFGGKSYLAALLSATEAATLGADVCVLGGSQSQSDNVHLYSGQFLSSEKLAGFLSGTPMKRETTLTMGNKILSLAASPTSVRSPHTPRLRLDEADEMDLSLLDASLGIPMSRKGIPQQIVIGSTHQYSSGTMTEVLRRAADRSWPVYRWCYRECLEPHGWLPQEDVDTKRLMVSAAMWANEYELQEPSPEGRAIDPACVKAAFSESLGSFRGQLGEYLEIEEPVPDGRYATGADWARKVDFTVIVTFRVDVKPFRLVAFERMQRLAWPTMIMRFENRLQRYPGRGAHDATGLGDVIAGYMTEEAEPVIMAGRARSEMLSHYVTAVENGDVVFPMIDFMFSEHLYASQEDVYGSGHLPDSISAGALALMRADESEGVFLFAVGDGGRLLRPDGSISFPGEKWRS